MDFDKLKVYGDTFISDGLVYTVDDRATFGETDKNILIWDYQNHFFQPIFIWNLQFQNLRKTCLFTYKEAEVLRESQAS